MPSEITKLFLQHGLLGAVAILALVYGWRKDREARAAAKDYQARADKQAEDHRLQMERLADRYIAKAETWTDRYHELARELKSLLVAIRQVQE